MDWGDWDKVSEQLCDTAALHGLPKKVELDLDLEALLNHRRTACITKQEKGVLNRRNGRRR